MLLLQENQLIFQDAIDSNTEKSLPIIGLFYDNKIFKKIKSFPKSELESAQTFAYRFSLDPNVACLLVEESDLYTVWYEDNRLEPYHLEQQKDNLIERINLRKLVRDMRDVDGVKIQDRRYRLNIYKRCMVGSEITTWLVRKFFISEAEAVKIGQRLMDAKLLHHVTDDRSFEDGYFFYRFYADED